MATIEALPGRVILEFPPATESVRGGIIIPQRSRRRVEFARLVHCGAAVNQEQEILRAGIIEAANRGLLFTIPVASGQACYQVELEQDTREETYGQEKDQDLGDLNYLKSLRTYAISQLHTVIRHDDTMVRFPERSE